MAEEDRAGRVPRSPEKPKVFGILPQHFTQDLLTDVLIIYADVARGDRRFDAYTLNEAWVGISEELDFHPFAEMRYGSVLTIDSKLWVSKKFALDGGKPVEVLDFSFDPNISRDEANFQRGQEMAEEFREKINQYLLKNGKARLIPWPY